MPWTNAACAFVGHLGILAELVQRLDRDARWVQNSPGSDHVKQEWESWLQHGTRRLRRFSIKRQIHNHFPVLCSRKDIGIVRPPLVDAVWFGHRLWVIGHGGHDSIPRISRVHARSSTQNWGPLVADHLLGESHVLPNSPKQLCELRRGDFRCGGNEWAPLDKRSTATIMES